MGKASTTVNIHTPSMHNKSSEKGSARGNYGAILFQKDFLSPSEINEAVALANELGKERRAVHQKGKYAHLRWFECDIKPDWPIAAKLLDELGAQNPELMLFYYLEPGAKIHPHRDLSGAALSNRIRFHVPIITNPDVFFMVDKQRVIMNPGELWCLDTSYLHSVANEGTEYRVHMVVECDINKNLKSRIPNNFKTKLHTITFIFIMSSLFAKSLLLNSFRDPRYLWSQIMMIIRYVGWRFLGIGTPR